MMGYGYVDNSPQTPSCPHTHSPYYDGCDGGGYFFDYQMGTFSVVKVQTK
jgi:hypothetical protein